MNDEDIEKELSKIKTSVNSYQYLNSINLNDIINRYNNLLTDLLNEIEKLKAKE